MNDTSTQLFLHAPSLAGGVKTVLPDAFPPGARILIAG